MTVSRRLRRGAALVGWTSIDQLFCALSNLIVTLAAARSGTETLGRFAVAFAAYLLVMGCARSLVSEPLLAARMNGDGADRRSEQSSVTLTVWCSIVGAAVLAVPGAVLSRPELVVMGAVLPVVLLQDLMRYHAFRRRRPELAALLDGSWVVGSVAAWPVVVTAGSAATAVGCWGAGGALAVLAGSWWMRPRPASLDRALDWWRREAKALARPLLADSIFVVVSLQTIVFVVAFAIGDEGMGIIRAGQVYFAPLGQALTALGVVAVPYLARRPELLCTRRVLQVSAVLTVVAACVCLLVLVAEPVLKPLLFGDAIDVPFAVMLPLACQVVLTASVVGLVICAKVDQRGGDIARSRFLSCLCGLVLLIGGTALFGLAGAVWSMAVQALWFATELLVRTVRCRASARARVLAGVDG